MQPQRETFLHGKSAREGLNIEHIDEYKRESAMAENDNVI